MPRLNDHLMIVVQQGSMIKLRRKCRGSPAMMEAQRLVGASAFVISLSAISMRSSSMAPLFLLQLIISSRGENDASNILSSMRLHGIPVCSSQSVHASMISYPYTLSSR